MRPWLKIHKIVSSLMGFILELTDGVLTTPFLITVNDAPQAYKLLLNKERPSFLKLLMYKVVTILSKRVHFITDCCFDFSLFEASSATTDDSASLSPLLLM